MWIQDCQFTPHGLFSFHDWYKYAHKMQEPKKKSCSEIMLQTTNLTPNLPTQP